MRATALFLVMSLTALPTVLLADEGDHFNLASPTSFQSEVAPASYAPAADFSDYAGVDDSDPVAASRKWTFRGAFLHMHRAAPRSRPIVIDFTFTESIIDAESLKFDFAPGWEVGANRQVTDRLSFEGRYLQVDSWNATSMAASRGAGVAFIGGGASIGGAGATAVSSANYTSLLRSAEFSGRFQLNDWLACLAGVRYFNVDERIKSLSVFTGSGLITSGVRTSNNLWGGQFGLDGCLVSSPLARVDLMGKLGFYNNNASYLGESSLNSVPTSGTADEQAFTSELGVNTTLFIHDHVSLRAGYQMLWLTGMALASEQYGEAFRPFQTNGHMFMHGLMFGTEVTW